MNKNIEFFDNEMDEKTVESISDDFPILTDDEKDRIFSRIEKEIDSKNSTIKYEEYNYEVNGVERCNRPRWMELFGTAAMIAVVIGGFGLGKYCMKNMNKTAPKDNEQEITTEIRPTLPDDSKTTDSSKPKVTTTNTNSSVKSVTTSFVKVVVPVYEDDTEKTGKDDIKDDKNVMAEPVNENRDDVTTLKVTDLSTTTTTETTTFTETKVTVTGTTGTTYTPVVNFEKTITQTADRTKELTEIAESTIERYDIVTLIRVLQLPTDESCEMKTLVHGPGMYSSRAYYNSYKKVDASVFSTMQEMRDFYYSVISEPETKDSLFGPELTTEQIEDDFYFNSDEPNYFYISIDGEHYELVISKKEIDERSEFPVVLSNIEDNSFTASKIYYKGLGDGSIETIFSFIKDVDSGKWHISDVSYNGIN